MYGASKAAGEQLVRQHLPRHIILRTSWVYGVHGHNFVKAILKVAQDQATQLRVVADQKGCPTAAEDIADTLLDLVARIVEAARWAAVGHLPLCRLGHDHVAWLSGGDHRVRLC